MFCCLLDYHVIALPRNALHTSLLQVSMNIHILFTTASISHKIYINNHSRQKTFKYYTTSLQFNIKLKP